MTDQWTPSDEPHADDPDLLSRAGPGSRPGARSCGYGVVIGSLVVLVASGAVAFGPPPTPSASPTATAPSASAPAAKDDTPSAKGPAGLFGGRGLPGWFGGFGIKGSGIGGGRVAFGRQIAVAPRSIGYQDVEPQDRRRNPALFAQTAD